MIQISEENQAIIDLLIDKNQLFALYKMPKSEEWCFVMQDEGEPEIYTDLNDLNTKEGYVIAPFQLSSTYPIVLLRIDRRSLPTYEEALALQTRSRNSDHLLNEYSEKEMYQSYQTCFHHFMKPLEEGDMAKLVLSRSCVQKKNKAFSLAQAFEKACNSYPNGYVYLVNTTTTGMWMGSTPEILLKGEGENWQTVALAGTQPIDQKKAPLWDDKNILEQDLVVQYVRDQLHTFGVQSHIKGPMNIKAGPVVHLVSSFDFKMNTQDKMKLGSLLNLLHPTPAVCGLPKQDAYAFILAHEHHSRKYYSGFIGELNPKAATHLYVNLRCMQVHAESYTLYAGGGLLSSSVLHEEWLETENKMKTMKAILK